MRDNRDREPSINLLLLAATSDLKAIKKFRERLGHIVPEVVFTKATNEVAQRIHVAVDQAIGQIVGAAQAI